MEQVSNKDDMKTSLKKVVKEVSVKGWRGELSSPVGRVLRLAWAEGVLAGYCEGLPSLQRAP